MKKKELTFIIGIVVFALLLWGGMYLTRRGNYGSIRITVNGEESVSYTHLDVYKRQLLIKGADFFVEGSSSLARFLKIPSVIIGLTIVAMGTSAPEASVSINAALAGNNDIAVSNIIGSNIFNGLVVVGICAFISGFKTNRDILKRDMPCLLYTSRSISDMH